MEKNKIIEALKQAKENSKARKFKQSFDLVVNLKDLDLKKPEQQIDFFITLHHDIGRKMKVCALIGPESKEESKAADNIITLEQFDKYQQDKKLTKKLAGEYDFFVAQANLMGKVASAFGRILGSRGKMPNPKGGCVVPPKSNLKPLVDKLQQTVRVMAKTSLIFQCSVGKEDGKIEDVAENVQDIYKSLVQHLPAGENNLKSVLIKTTMGTPVKLV